MHSSANMKSVNYAEKKLHKISVRESTIQYYEHFLDLLTKELPKIPEINAVVLFGSFARGDYSLRHSDIDLMVFLDKEKKEAALEEQIKKKIFALSITKELSPHIVFQYKKIEDEDKSLMVTIAREGKVLFARKTIVISLNQAGLASYYLLRFQTAGCKAIAKNKLQRFLYGYKVKGKQYKGLVDEEKVFSAGRGAIMVPEEIHQKVLHLAHTIGVKTILKGRFYK